MEDRLAKETIELVLMIWGAVILGFIFFAMLDIRSELKIGNKLKKKILGKLDAGTGIIGVSNNIPQFTNDLSKIKPQFPEDRP